jgi:hypothetical protein
VTCANIAGAWSLASYNTCGEHATQGTMIVQTDCDISFAGPLVGSAMGQLDDTGTADLTIQLPAACSTDGTVGRLEILSDVELRLVFGNGTDCCRHGGGTFSR